MRVENVSDLLLVHRRNAVLASHGINTNTRSPPTVDIGEQAFGLCQSLASSGSYARTARFVSFLTMFLTALYSSTTLPHDERLISHNFRLRLSRSLIVLFSHGACRLVVGLARGTQRAVAASSTSRKTS